VPDWLPPEPVKEEIPANQAAATQPTPVSGVVPVEPAARVEAAAQVSAEPAAPSAAPDLEKLSRLAERLAAQRRQHEEEMEARFAEQRSQQEAARRWVEERMESKPWAPPEVSAVPEPPAVPAEPPPPASVPEAVGPSPAATTQPALPEETAAERRTQPRPSIRARQRPAAPPQAAPASAPTPAVASAAAPVVPAEALAHGQVALSSGDYAAAVTHLAPLVEQGQHLDSVVRSLEGAAGGGQAPAPVLQLLGDAYLRNDQTQKALDAYRQALRRL
jgi:hypothetical protein